MFRKYGLYIIVVILFILSLLNNDGTVESSFRLMCLIMPLWFAGSIGERAIDGVYEISKVFLRHLIKKPLPERVHLPAFIYDTVPIVIAAVIQIGVYCWLAAAMAKTYLYADFFTTLTTGHEWFSGANIHDLLSAYFTIYIITYMIISFADVKRPFYN